MVTQKWPELLRILTTSKFIVIVSCIFLCSSSVASHKIFELNYTDNSDRIFAEYFGIIDFNLYIKLFKKGGWEQRAQLIYKIAQGLSKNNDDGLEKNLKALSSQLVNYAQFLDQGSLEKLLYVLTVTDQFYDFVYIESLLNTINKFSYKEDRSLLEEEKQRIINYQKDKPLKNINPKLTKYSCYKVSVSIERCLLI